MLFEHRLAQFWINMKALQFWCFESSVGHALITDAFLILVIHEIFSCDIRSYVCYEFSLLEFGWSCLRRRYSFYTSHVLLRYCFVIEDYVYVILFHILSPIKFFYMYIIFGVYLHF